MYNMVLFEDRGYPQTFKPVDNLLELGGGIPFSDKPIYEWDMIGCNVMDVPGRS